MVHVQIRPRYNPIQFFEGRSTVKKLDFNQGWKFHKTGEEKRLDITLPHDAMIHENRSPDSAGGSANGYFLGGIYEYEKRFVAPSSWQDQSVYFEFEGVHKDSEVSINGVAVKSCPNGYMPFWVDASELIKVGEENTIHVVADNSKMPCSRWYTGGGIYRPVWVHVGAKTHILPEGVKITTLSYAPARIRVETQHVGGDVSVAVANSHGTVVANGEGSCVELDVPDAALWSDEAPNLYTCRVSLQEDGAVVDEAVETFGIRVIEWSPKGFRINGKDTLLRGGCIHHDNGILGAATYAESEERRVRIMKEVGFNALRSSHNATSKAMLEACDKHGMYIMDETWDMWYFHKSKFDYATHFWDWYKYDLKALVDRDYNHPSVIMYSIGNEVSEPKDEKGVNLTKEMVSYVHTLDVSRPVTAGINLMVINAASQGNGIYNEEGGRADDAAQDKKKMAMDSSTMFNMITSQVGTGMNNSANSKEADEITSPCLDALDIAGYNYTSGRYPLEGKAHPERIIMGTETFPQDIYKNWEMVKEYPYLIGDFMWTAWDYLGEAGIGTWAYTDDARAFDKPYPWLLSDSGAIDILGNVGAEAEYAATVWHTRKTPYIGVQPVNHPGVVPAKAVWRGTNAIPSWSWKNCDGNEAVVEVYADAASVELSLNGESIGKEDIEACKAIFTVQYTPGKLTAIAYDAAGCEIGQAELMSADDLTSIRVSPEQVETCVGGVVYVPVELIGGNGIIQSNDDQTIFITVEGGELLAFGSANPRTEERYDSGTFTTYYGRALAVVRATTPGIMTVRATCDHLSTTESTISVR